MAVYLKTLTPGFQSRILPWTQTKGETCSTSDRFCSIATQYIDASHPPRGSDECCHRHHHATLLQLKKRRPYNLSETKEQSNRLHWKKFMCCLIFPLSFKSQIYSLFSTPGRWRFTANWPWNYFFSTIDWECKPGNTNLKASLKAIQKRGPVVLAALLAAFQGNLKPIRSSAAQWSNFLPGYHKQNK